MECDECVCISGSASASCGFETMRGNWFGEECGTFWRKCCLVLNSIYGGHAQTFIILCSGVKLSTWNVVWRQPGHADIYMLGTELVQFSLYDDCAMGWWSWVQFLARLQDFSFLQNAHTGSGTSTASSAVGGGVSLLRGVAAGSWSVLLSFI